MQFVFISRINSNMPLVKIASRRILFHSSASVVTVSGAVSEILSDTDGIFSVSFPQAANDVGTDIAVKTDNIFFINITLLCECRNAELA